MCYQKEVRVIRTFSQKVLKYRTQSGMRVTWPTWRKTSAKTNHALKSIVRLSKSSVRFAPIARPSTTEGPVTSGLAIFQPSRWDEVFDFYMPTWTFSSMLYNELPYLRLFLNTYASLHTSTRGTKLEVGITGASDVRIKTTVVDLFEQNFSDLVLTESKHRRKSS